MYEILNCGVYNSTMRQNKIYTVDDETLKLWYTECVTYTEILAKYGLQNRGAYNTVLKNRLISLNLDLNKFAKRCKPTNTITDESVIFCINSKVHRHVVKKRFIKLVKYECKECGQNENWNLKPLVLILDHINGNSIDNRLENLRLLCPNCNSQTDTFAGRNTKQQRKRYYCECGNEISSQALSCKPCSNLKRNRPSKINWPNKEELAKDLFERPAQQIAKTIGCSDTMLSTYCRKNNIPKPERGYWMKKKYNLL